ncbi:MAG TPA: hypothetical protein VGB40_05080 [Rubrobacteraceae bacterium]|jgi:hypothetical protein
MRAAMRLLVDKKGLLMGRHVIRTLITPQPVRRAGALTSLYNDLRRLAGSRGPAF